VIYEDATGPLTYAQSKEKFERLLDWSLEPGAADSQPITGYGISDAIDQACHEVAVANRDGGDVQLATDNAWIAFHELYSS
jgi:hypothetical protein